MDGPFPLLPFSSALNLAAIAIYQSRLRKREFRKRYIMPILSFCYGVVVWCRIVKDYGLLDIHRQTGEYIRLFLPWYLLSLPPSLPPLQLWILLD